MSDVKKEETPTPEGAPKKKKGKLPIIIALVAILGGGGFFMMKGKGKKAEKPEIKLGAIEPVPEFLVNLKGSETFLRTEVALQFAEGFKKEELDKNLPAVRDAILSSLTSKTANDLKTLEGKRRLKNQIAAAVNALFPAKEEHPEPKVEEGAKEPKKDAHAKVEKSPEHADWDSQTGPCLKVFFTSFAMQY